MEMLPVLAAVLALGALAPVAIAPGPAGVAFYTPPSPLPPGPNGSVVWMRDLDHSGSTLPSAARNVLVLYRTTSATGTPVVVTGTIAIPKGTPPADGWPVISWTHGTTGNAPECAPSRGDEPNLEQRSLDHWVARGDVVLQTDYEGEGTPGIHPYMVGAAAGHDATDLVRAARAVDPEIGTRWVVMGHSEGGHAALFTAGVGPAWAPELQLLGTVPIAPASHLLAALRTGPDTNDANPFFPFLLMMIQGAATTDPTLDLSKVLTPEAIGFMQHDLSSRCIDDLVSAGPWMTRPESQFFVRGADLVPLESAFVPNEPTLLHLTVPVLLLQGSADDMVAPEKSMYLAGELCDRGATVDFETFKGEDHGSVIGASLSKAEQWVDDRFAGKPAPSTCKK